MTQSKDNPKTGTDGAPPPAPGSKPGAKPMPKEIGGRGGPEPTRYGDWEVNGRCVDF